jgi:alkanesulfonate monooxygenase SsuD/methylene tetrahydromethanopterin reductase-like flavin-dependent oxidoreductase (luciferase family)
MATERAKAAGKTRTKAMARLSKIAEETEKEADELELEAAVAAEEAKMEAEKL